MKASSINLVCVLAALTVLSYAGGCELLDSPSGTGLATDQDSALVGPTWVLQALNGRTSLPDGEVTVRFTDIPPVPGDFVGDRDVGDNPRRLFAGLFCSGGGAVYGLKGRNRIIIGNIVADLISCGEEKDAVIGTFLSVIRQVDRYVIEGDRLTLRDESGDTSLLFRKEAEDEDS